MIARLSAEENLPPAVLQRLCVLSRRLQTVEPRGVLQVEEETPPRPRYVVSGWAARLRYLGDGRRLIFDLILPGDGLAVCLRRRPLAQTTVVALTRIELAEVGNLLDAQELEAHPGLAGALEQLADADEQRMLNHMMRLGRMTALERVAHLLLELHERMAVIGAVKDDEFSLPLTQETLSDHLGLSVVHVNRTLQELRRQNLVKVERGSARLCDRAALARLADYPLAPASSRTVG